MQSLKALKTSFSLRHKVANATLNFLHAPSPLMLTAIGTMIEARDKTRPNRVSQFVGQDACKVFVKIQRIETLPKKLRIMLGRPKRSGRFDWPLEELMNTVTAAELGIDGARVYGFGLIKPKFGIVREFVLLTEFLDEHINGLQWLEKYPERACEFIERCLLLVASMNSKGFTHMDLWVANIMVPQGQDLVLKVIDMENVFTRQSAFGSETLGLQLGFLYRKDLHRFIDEAQYDRLVSNFLLSCADVDAAAFERTYSASKHMKLSHRKRRRVFLEGVLDPA